MIYRVVVTALLPVAVILLCLYLLGDGDGGWLGPPGHRRHLCRYHLLCSRQPRERPKGLPGRSDGIRNLYDMFVYIVHVVSETVLFGGGNQHSFSFIRRF